MVSLTFLIHWKRAFGKTRLSLTSFLFFPFLSHYFPNESEDKTVQKHGLLSISFFACLLYQSLTVLFIYAVFFYVPFYSIQRESSCLWTNVVSQHGPLYDSLSNFPFPFIRIHITRHHLCQDIHPPTSSLVRRSLQISDFLEVFLFLDVDVEFLDRRPVAVGEELVHGLVQVFLHSREAVVLVGVRLWGGERENRGWVRWSAWGWGSSGFVLGFMELCEGRGKGMMSQYDRKCWKKKGLASTKEATSVGWIR